MSEPRKNASVTLFIDGVNGDGFGVGRLGDTGLAVFVDGALPGEHVRARLVKVKPRYAYAKLEKVLKAAPFRVTPPCPLAARCGGCQLMHCAYAQQLKFKEQTVRDALNRIGGFADPPVAPVRGMPESDALGYRNKAVFPITPAGIGMYAPRSHRLVPVTRCLLHHPAHEAVLAALGAYMERCAVPAYDETAHSGLLRHVMVRTARRGGGVMAVLAVNGQALPRERALSELMHEAGVATLVLNMNKKRGNTVLGPYCRVLYGSGFVTEQLGGVQYRLTPRAFFQVNPAQAEVLYGVAVEMAGLGRPADAETFGFADAPDNPDGPLRTVLDAHAGNGGVALWAAKRAARVLAVEIDPDSANDAEHNARLNGLDNLRVVRGAAENAVPKLLAEETVDTVLLDPPRKGCGPELIGALTKAAVPRVVYLSCDPATLARDARLLCGGGYALTRVQPVDMFPQTGRVECACLFMRAQK